MRILIANLDKLLGTQIFKVAKVYVPKVNVNALGGLPMKDTVQTGMSSDLNNPSQLTRLTIPVTFTL
jgi:hypothetical protein